MYLVLATSCPFQQFILLKHLLSISDHALFEVMFIFTGPNIHWTHPTLDQSWGTRKCHVKDGLLSTMENYYVWQCVCQNKNHSRHITIINWKLNQYNFQLLKCLISSLPKVENGVKILHAFNTVHSLPLWSLK